jgi:hypothetical protein
VRDDLTSAHSNNEEPTHMARKGNNPDKMDAETDAGTKDVETKRRYQSPQTPPQAPRSRTQESRDQGKRDDTGSFDGEGHDEGEAGQRRQQTDHGTWQEHSRSQEQNRDQAHEQSRQGGRADQGERQAQQQKRQDGEEWQGKSDGQADGKWANRGADFDLQKASRDELNAIAMELNIDDYETMNREELVSEIRERS